MSGPQTLSFTYAPEPPSSPPPLDPPSAPPPPSPPQAFEATTSVALGANATKELTVDGLKATLIAAVNTSEQAASVLIQQATIVAIEVDAEASTESYLASVQASVCANANGACEVRVVSARRRQLQAQPVRGDAEDDERAADKTPGEAGAGEAESVGDGHDRGPPDSDGRPPAPAPTAGPTPLAPTTVPPPSAPGGEGAAAAAPAASSSSSSWVSHAFSRVGRLWRSAASGRRREVGEGEEAGGGPAEEEGVARGARRLQTSGYSITFEIIVTPSSGASLDTSASSSALVSALTTSLGNALGTTPTVATPAVTSTTATITFSQTGTSEDAAAALSTTLSSNALTSALAESLGVSASDLVVAAASIAFPPGAPPASPPPSPATPPPSPPPYSNVRSSACDACTCQSNLYNDALCLGECTWQTDMLRRICPNLAS